MTDYGDIRDVLQALPHPPHDGTAYALTDLFTVRHEIIRQLDPQPTSVFEFGTLFGYFLVTALDAAPSIDRVGWVDNETHTPGSNQIALANVTATRPDIDPIYVYDRGDAGPALFQSWDLVQVDSDHSFEGCLFDLNVALAMQPRWIMVDDWIAEGHRQAIKAAVQTWLKEAPGEWRLDEYVTQNGLAVLTRT